MHRGYIKLWRKMDDWSWYRSSETFHLFCHLLLRANHKPYTFMGYEIQRGQVVTGRNQLASDTGISPRSIRTSITRLKSTNDLTIKTTNRFSIISIVNYELYQSETTSKTTSKTTNERPATDQQPTTIKECKNDKNEKNKAFVKPTQEEVLIYCTEQSIPLEAEKFFDHFTTNGWRVGKAGLPMRDWRSAVRNWKRNSKNFSTTSTKPTSDLDAILEKKRKENENAKLYA